MDIDTDKIDGYTLALLHLVIFDREDGVGGRAWKGFDWATMDRLHQQGYIGNPKGKAKSVSVTDEGVKTAQGLFQHLFGR